MITTYCHSKQYFDWFN